MQRQPTTILKMARQMQEMVVRSRREGRRSWVTLSKNSSPVTVAAVVDVVVDDDSFGNDTPRRVVGAVMTCTREEV